MKNVGGKNKIWSEKTMSTHNITNIFIPKKTQNAYQQKHIKIYKLNSSGAKVCSPKGCILPRASKSQGFWRKSFAAKQC